MKVSVLSFFTQSQYLTQMTLKGEKKRKKCISQHEQPRFQQSSPVHPRKEEEPLNAPSYKAEELIVVTLKYCLHCLTGSFL